VFAEFSNAYFEFLNSDEDNLELNMENELTLQIMNPYDLLNPAERNAGYVAVMHLMNKLQKEWETPLRNMIGAEKQTTKGKGVETRGEAETAQERKNIESQQGEGAKIKGKGVETREEAETVQKRKSVESQQGEGAKTKGEGVNTRGEAETVQKRKNVESQQREGAKRVKEEDGAVVKGQFLEEGSDSGGVSAKGASESVVKPRQSSRTTRAGKFLSRKRKGVITDSF
jgi:hypothetical protein